MIALTINGKRHADFDADALSVTLPASAHRQDPDHAGGGCRTFRCAV